MDHFILHVLRIYYIDHKKKLLFILFFLKNNNNNHNDEVFIFRILLGFWLERGQTRLFGAVGIGF